MCACHRIKYYLEKNSRFVVFQSQNASGQSVDPVVSFRKQLDGERIHGKLLHNNLCLSLCVCVSAAVITFLFHMRLSRRSDGENQPWSSHLVVVVFFNTL